ncbi:ABC transporter permease [Pyruvatibacter sp.]|uniref:ABC transporter permease n=1 Tax=Pyruvatibacter sp. TaxID=1981328 RepID=UPI0032EB1D16
MFRALNPVRLATVGSDVMGVLVKHRALLADQVRREIVDQHAGQVMGGVWSIIHPVFLMLIYVFVFGVVFETRVGGTREMPLDYTSYILAGLAPWLAIVQMLSKSASSLTSNSSLIKQVVFPIEVLPAKSTISTLLPLLVMMACFFAYTWGLQGQVFWTHALVPVLIGIYLLWALGIGYFLASLTVFVRDIRELVQVFAVAGVFLIPVIYLPAWVPKVFEPVLYVNPFSYIIWCFQDALYFGRIDHPWAWVVSILGGLLVFALGARTFRFLKPHFGDNL